MTSFSIFAAGAGAAKTLAYEIDIVLEMRVEQLVW